MRLKSLKLSGFKSFANPTTFSFKHDITAIVGPNGCGKSNVIDAIRWVLGETSAKQLRGGAMSDVIFAGTDGKAGKSLASVELTFEHTQDEKSGIRHALNLYHELTLRRQITLDGKSDYFINNQRVRRRDVVDVFLGTGLGARSYAVIEQGMIGRIIDADGEKLREFIEEAAGVSRYQARRAETQKQLQIATDNLARLSDLQSELVKQHKTLVKQAEAAQIFEKISSELKTIEKQVLNHRLYNAWIEHKQHSAEQQKQHQALDTLTQTMSQIHQKWNSVASKLAEVGWQKDQAVQNEHKANLALTDSTHALTTCETEQNSLYHQLDKVILELDNRTSKQGSDTAEKAHHFAKVNELSPRLTELDNELSQKRHAQNLNFDEKETVRKELSALYNDRQTLQNRLTLNEANLNRTAQALAKWEHKKQAWQKEMSELGNLTPTDLTALTDKMANLSIRLDELDDIINHDKLALTKLSTQVSELKKELGDNEKQHSKYQSEYDTLHRLVYPPKLKMDNETVNKTSDFQLNHFNSIQSELQLTELGKTYSDKLDAWIGVLLSDVGVNNDEFNEVLENLTLLDNHNTHSVWQKNSNKTSVNLPKGLIKLSELIKSPSLAIFDKVAVIIDEIEKPFVVSLSNHNGFSEPFDKQRANGKTLSQLSQDLGILIMDKDWLIGAEFILHKNKFGKGDDKFLSTRTAHLNRLEELENELNAIETLIETQSQTLKKSESDESTLKRQLEEYLVSEKSLIAELNALKHTHAKTVSEMSAFEKDKKRLLNQEIDLDKEKSELEFEHKTLASECQTLKANLDEIYPKINALKSTQDKFNLAENELTTHIKALQNERQAVEFSLQTHRQAIDFIEKNEKFALDEVQKLQADKANLEKKLAELDAKLPALKADKDEKARTAYECKVLADGYDDSLKTLQGEQNALSNDRTTTQESIDETHERLGTVGASVAVALAKMQEIGEQLLEKEQDFNLSARLADFGHANFKLDGELKALTAEQKRLASELGKLGAVNLTAMAELAELEARLMPMTKEKQDVEDSITTLQGAIDEINQKTKTLFLDTLQAVNADLNALFGKVFGGGQASLTLMDDETLSKSDKWQAGLELMAQPKGKKNSRLAVLSGGEKTLTALSLIFAIFKQNPAPFCVLDEVDAPLDDANVGRFTGLIDELAKDVQFIFISHNKLAMQTAHELKGVTMPTAGISALVSVDLGEAMAMVE